jgi:hypothetical protein
MNFSNFVGGETQDLQRNTLTGFNAGAFVGFYLGNNFSIQPEVLFSTQGAKLESVAQGDKEDFRLNYVNIPVMAKFEFNNGFYLETGPLLGINVSNGNFGNQRVKDLTNNTDFGWGAGLGYHAHFGLGIGARYNVGLSKVANAGFTNPDYRNSVIQVGLFYTIFNNRRSRSM